MEKEVFENKSGIFTYQVDKENHVHCFTSDNPNLTDDEIDNKILEMNKPSEHSDDFKATQYQRDRATSYPSIQEQLDMQYWDAVNGTKKWQEAVAKVKTDNPKPE